MVEIDKRVGRPQTGSKFLAGDDFTRPLQQKGDDLERLFLKSYLGPVAAQFASPQIDLKDSEAYNLRRTVGLVHVEPQFATLALLGSSSNSLTTVRQ